mgnify:CR=1 FL=1
MADLDKKNGLFTPEEVEIYTNPEFIEDQILVIKSGFLHNLTLEQVKIYAKPEFSAGQMGEIEKGLIHGLSNEQVKVYAVPELKRWQMEDIRTAMECGRTIEEMKYCVNKNFSTFQISMICTGFEKGLSKEQVSIYAKPFFGVNQMEAIYEGFIKGLTMEQVKTFAKKKYNNVKMKQISRLYENDTPSIPSWNIKMLNIISSCDVSEECIRLCANPKFNDIQIENLCDMIRDYPDFNLEQIEIIANPLLSGDQMMILGSCFAMGATMEQIDVIANPKFSVKQMKIIEDGFKNDIPVEQIKTFAKPELTLEMMNVYKDCYAAGIKDVDLYLNIMTIYSERSEEYRKELIRAAAKGFSLTKIKLLAEKNLSTEQLRFIIDSAQTSISPKEENNKKETREER